MNIIHVKNIEDAKDRVFYCASPETYTALMEQLEHLSPRYRWYEGQKPTGYVSAHMPTYIEISESEYIAARSSNVYGHDKPKRVVL